MQTKYWHPNFEKKVNQIQKKSRFLGLRLEPDKFLQLKQEASERNLDLSSLIRLKLEGKNE